jgi:phosphoenolpyruvate synthase/pyruvate phosphate dikinase
MLQLFRNFQADRMDLDELVYLAAVGSQLRAEYEKHNLEEPDWVDVQLKALKREIFARNADKLEARRKEIASRLESLKTPQQKKTELLKEQAEINRKLTAIGA